MIRWELTTVPLGRASQLSGRAHCWPPSPRATSQPRRPQGSEAGWGSGRTHSLGGPLTLPAAQVPIPPRAWQRQRVPQSILPCPQATGVSNEGEGAPPCTLCSALMSPGECSGMLQKPSSTQVPGSILQGPRTGSGVLGLPPLTSQPLGCSSGWSARGF